MKSQVQLPVVMPRFSAYNYLGYMGIAADSNKGLDNWYFNHCIQIECTRKYLEQNYPVFVALTSEFTTDMPFFDKRKIEASIAGHCLHAFIKAYLNEGFYVVFNGIDNFYIEGKSGYQEIHHAHDGMITGYDDERKTYTIVAYDSNWLFRPFESSQEGFLKAFHSEFVPQESAYFTMIRVTDEMTELDVPFIKQGLLEYLDSDMEKYPPYCYNYAYGTVVHDYTSLYIEHVEDGRNKVFDARPIRMLWEHKKCMLDRIKAVETQMELNHEISAQYALIPKNYEILHMLYAKYNLAQRDKPELLIRVRKKVMELKDAETQLLTLLCEKI